MTAEQRAPLAAFFVLLLASVAVLANAMRTDAMSSLFVAPAQSVIAGTRLAPLPQELLAAGVAALTPERKPDAPATITDQVVTHMVAVRVADAMARGTSSGPRPGGGRSRGTGAILQQPVRAVTATLNNSGGLTAGILSGETAALSAVANGAGSVAVPASASAAASAAAAGPIAISPTAVASAGAPSSSAGFDLDAPSTDADPDTDTTVGSETGAGTATDGETAAGTDPTEDLGLPWSTTPESDSRPSPLAHRRADSRHDRDGRGAGRGSASHTSPGAHPHATALGSRALKTPVRSFGHGAAGGGARDADRGLPTPGTQPPSGQHQPLQPPRSYHGSVREAIHGGGDPASQRRR